MGFPDSFSHYSLRNWSNINRTDQAYMEIIRGIKQSMSTCCWEEEWLQIIKVQVLFAAIRRELFHISCLFYLKLWRLYKPCMSLCWNFSIYAKHHCCILEANFFEFGRERHQQTFAVDDDLAFYDVIFVQLEFKINSWSKMISHVKNV